MELLTCPLYLSARLLPPSLPQAPTYRAHVVQVNGMVRHFPHDPPFALGRIGSLYCRRSGAVHFKEGSIDRQACVSTLAFPRGGRRAVGTAAAVGGGAGPGAFAASA